jgi:hypothetical protein
MISKGNAMEDGSEFRESTYSFANGNCVEVGEDWRKSSRSVANGACVETGSGLAGVLVRDTADRGGRVLAFPAGAWAAFTAGLAAAER